MTHPANNHDAMLYILTFTLIGCRDASMGKFAALAKAEYHLAKIVRGCLAQDNPERHGVVLEAIREFRMCNGPEVPERADMYEYLLSTCRTESKTESQLTTSPRSTALLQILTLGMSRLSQALEKEDLDWAAIEGDHIHNIPGMLDIFRQTNLSYYLEAERSLFEERIAERTDLTDAPNDWRELRQAWHVLERE